MHVIAATCVACTRGSVFIRSFAHHTATTSTITTSTSTIAVIVAAAVPWVLADALLSIVGWFAPSPCLTSIGRYEHIVEEEEERARRKAAHENEREQLLGDWMNKVRGRGGDMLRKVTTKLEEKKSHLPIHHSLRDNGVGGGMCVLR